MEGFLISIIALVGFIGYSGIFLMIFFLSYYLYLRGTVKGKGREDKERDKNKKLGKRILK